MPLYKIKQFFFVLIKLSIVVAAGYFIYNKLLNNSSLQFNTFFKMLVKHNLFTINHMLLLLALSALNWFLEIIKWQKLSSVIQSNSFYSATAQTLGALTASIFTPNRIGEYGAKAIFYSPPLRKKIMFTNLLSNVLQMSITVLLGSIGLSFYINYYSINLNYYNNYKLFAITLVILLFILFFTYFTIHKFNIIPIKRFKRFIRLFSRKTISIGLVLSLTRYLIFSFQFFLILLLFKAQISYLEAMCVITTLYFIVSIIPSVFILDIVIKGSVAVYLFSFLSISELKILSTISIMWLLNFALPSIIGSWYVLRFKYIKYN